MLRIILFCFILLNSSVVLSDDKQQTLIIALGDEPSTGFDPILGWGQYGDPLFQSTLLRRNEKLELTNELASGYQVLDDGLEWQIALKKDVLFSDGSNLSALDVVFTFNEIKKGRSTHDLSNLDQIIAKTPFSVTFVLKQPDISFVDKLTSIGIVSEKHYGPGYAQHPVGSGPYKLKRWDKGQQIILERNPYYFKKMPYFKKIIILSSSEDNRVALLRTKQIHMASIPQRYAKSIPTEYNLVSIPTNDNRGIVWPMSAPSNDQPGNLVTADWSIRKAVTMVMDKDLLAEKILNGYGRPANSLADGLPWGQINPKSEVVDYNAARKVLSDAGWLTKSQDQPLEKNGVKAEFDLYFPAGDSLRRDLSITISGLVKPLGIHARPVGANWGAIKSKMHSNPVLMGFGSHTMSEMFYLYDSQNAGVGWYNSGFYQNSEVDHLLVNVKHSLSVDDAAPYWKEMHRILDKDLPWTWLVNVDHLYAIDRCLDIGKTKPEPHQHGWPITSNIAQWTWHCQ